MVIKRSASIDLLPKTVSYVRYIRYLAYNCNLSLLHLLLGCSCGLLFLFQALLSFLGRQWIRLDSKEAIESRLRFGIGGVSLFEFVNAGRHTLRVEPLLIHQELFKSFFIRQVPLEWPYLLLVEHFVIFEESTSVLIDYVVYAAKSEGAKT